MSDDYAYTIDFRHGLMEITKEAAVGILNVCEVLELINDDCPFSSNPSDENVILIHNNLAELIDEYVGIYLANEIPATVFGDCYYDLSVDVSQILSNVVVQPLTNEYIMHIADVVRWYVSSHCNRLLNGHPNLVSLLEVTELQDIHLYPDSITFILEGV